MEKTDFFFPDATIEACYIVAGESQAAAHRMYHDTHTTGEMFSVNAEGAVVETTVMFMHDIESGCVARDQGGVA